MFAFEVEYLLGRAFAGDFRERSRPEWPPHPARLFSALASAFFENGADGGEKRALEWLEKEGPPFIRAGAAGDPVRTMAYVPTNYPGDTVPVLRNKQPRFFPAQGPAEATAYFVWPQAKADPETASALDALASRTSYLGKACSLVRMIVTESAPEPNWAPDERGRHVLRVPAPGRLAELERWFAMDLRPTAGAQQKYVCLDEAAADEEPASSEFGYMAVLRKVSGAGIPIDAVLTLTDAARRALIDIAAKTGAVTELLHGHNGGRHCAIAGLPFVGREHADGDVKGFAVILPRDAAPTERRDVLLACAELADNGLAIPGAGRWQLESVETEPPTRALRAETWVRPARWWRTVTPILLDRFPKPKGPTVGEIIGAACERIGLPAPVSIEHGPYSGLEGVPPVPAFRLRRKAGEKPRWGVHARLEFPYAVRGPVLIGAGRYFGLGLLRPEQEERK